MHHSWQKYVAEAVGTFAFVFIGAGAALANWQTGGSLQTLGVALAHGLMLAAMIYCAWHISGAHLNPAVTIALWATGHIKTLIAAGYVIAQLVGSVVAGILIKSIWGGIMSPQYFYGTPVLGAGITPAMGILVEAVLTFFLVWAFYAAIVDKKAPANFGGLVVGMVFAVGIMVGGAFTGAAMNPARAFGLALVSSHWTAHFVYWIGPVVGALVAGFGYHLLFGKPQE